MNQEQLQAFLENLERAYYSGHLKVKNGDKEIQFDSESALLKRIHQLKKELGLATKKPGRILMSTGKGLN